MGRSLYAVEVPLYLIFHPPSKAQHYPISAVCWLNCSFFVWSTIVIASILMFSLVQLDYWTVPTASLHIRVGEKYGYACFCIRTCDVDFASYIWFCSKSEYVIYKLKEMGKITEKDVMLICKQFERLDSGNCGRITLGDLMEHHH